MDFPCSNTFEIYLKENWFKYKKYEVNDRKDILVNGRLESNIKDKIIFYDPFENYQEILIDILMIGYKSKQMKLLKKLEEDTLDFCNKYGYLGLFNYNIEGFASYNKFIVRISKNNTEVISTDDYIRNFYREMSLLSITKEFVNGKQEALYVEDLKNYVNSPRYYESSYGITNYASKLYDDFLYFDEKSDNPELINEYYDMPKREIKNVVSYIGYEDKVIKKYKYPSLASAIDVMFLNTISDEKSNIRLCKNCRKPFIAKSLKSIYCSGTCRNTANVRAFRASQNEK